MRPFDPRLMRFASATRRFAIAAVVVGSLTAALVIGQAIALTNIVVPVFTDGADLDSVKGAILTLALLVAARAVLAYATEALAFRSSAAAKSQLRVGVLSHIMRLGPIWLSGRKSSELTQLLTRGIDGLDAYFSRYLPQLVLAVVVPLTVGIVIATQDVLAAVIVLVTVPLIPVFMILIGKYTQSRVNRQWYTLGRLAGHFADVVAGMSTLKVFGRAGAQAANVHKIGESYRAATMGVLRISFLSALVLEVLAMLSIALVAVSIGLRLVSGSMTLQAGLLVLILVPEVYLPLRQVGVHFHAAADGLGAARQLVDILEIEPIESGQLSPDQLGTAGIAFRDVELTYPGRSAPALQSLNVDFVPGKITALVGPSGCGKSTILAILARFIDPTKGEVSVVGHGGSHRIQDFDVEAWRSKVYWIGQHPELVSGTIAENVRLGRPEITDDQVNQSLTTMGLRPLVAELALGIHTPVGEAGRLLSVGQTRRVALARALVSGADVLLLDEPTAALDLETEAAVLAAIGQIAQTSTVIVVAHRPALIAAADVVLRLSQPEANPGHAGDLPALTGSSA